MPIGLLDGGLKEPGLKWANVKRRVQRVGPPAEDLRWRPVVEHEQRYCAEPAVRPPAKHQWERLGSHWAFPRADRPMRPG